MRYGFLTLPILFASATAIAQPSPTVTVDHAWARASAGATTTGAAYLTVTDHGAADHLVGASTPVAASAEVHETTNDNGVMKMRAVPSLALTPNAPVTFQPGGYHVMLMGLKAPLKPGSSFPLTLTFEHAPPVTTQVQVGPAGGSAPMKGMNMPGQTHG